MICDDCYNALWGVKGLRNLLLEIVIYYDTYDRGEWKKKLTEQMPNLKHRHESILGKDIIDQEETSAAKDSIILSDDSGYTIITLEIITHTR